MKKILLILFCISTLCNNRILGQTDSIVFPAEQSLYVEVIGETLCPLNVHYGRILKIYSNSYMTFNLGFGYFPTDINPILSIPFMIDWNSGLRNSHLEMGTGLSYNSGYYSSKIEELEVIGKMRGLFWALRLGYKYQRPEGGFFFKIGFTPLIRITEKYKIDNPSQFRVITDVKNPTIIYPMAGLAIGFSY